MTIDRRQPEPVQEQIRRLIYAEIKSGAYRADERLPTEKEFSERFGVSLAPVRAALAQLVQSGLLQRTQGRGTFLKNNKIQYTLQLLASCTDSLRQAGAEFNVEHVEINLGAIPEAIAKSLRLKPESAGLRLRRVISVEQQRAILLESWMPESFADLIEYEEDFAAGDSLYRKLRERGVEFSHSKGELEFLRCEGEVARLLSLPFGAPLFSISGVASNDQGTPIEWSRGLYDADRFSLRLEKSYRN